MTERLGCGQTEDLLAELATGAATGHDRALALEHVAACAACRRALDELVQAADALLLLAAPAEPPAGFESAVLARMTSQDARGRPRVPMAGWLPVGGRRLVAGAVALALAAALGAGVVWWRTEADRQLAAQHRQTLAVANGRYLKAARLSTGTGSPAGTVFLYQGTPSWLLVTVVDGGDGRYEIVAVDRAGAAHAVGWCEIRNRSGTAGYRIDVPVSSVAEIQLRGADGTRLMAKL
ncbi:hypothetical protein [Dactylosporangium darangshiense]|uniref:Zinc-finger domain-containing protein n=1 Tax=Dactylosporangium darangshiense TaxID=579108 RepID=A0ABP8CYB4_9ACTN